MKKAAIITITNGKLNFGNRLQNFALQTALQDKNILVDTIYSRYVFKNSLILSKLRMVIRTIKMFFMHNNRRKHFNSFDKRYINIAKTIRFENINEAKFNDQYNAFIAGSDQLWNPGFTFTSEFEFMTFADQSKRYSYAASFGVSEIPDKNKEKYAEMLSQIKEISVREDSAKDIVYNLTKRDAHVHIDPTLLLNAQRYSQLEVKPNSLPDKYILVYSLGDYAGEFKDFTMQISQKLNLPIVEINENIESTFYNIGPQHFLYMFSHAEYICTDSFHGSVFSIIYKKNFTVFSRAGKSVNMISRIETLLSKLNLENRFYGKLALDISLETIDYTIVDQNLLKEINISQEYFNKIISQW